MTDSVSVFADHAGAYHAERRRIVPCFDQFYGTAVEVLGLRGGPMLRILDLGAGTGLLSSAILDRYPDAEVVLLDGAAEMLDQARERLPAGTRTIVGDLGDALPDGPFDAVVSALAIHHVEHPVKRDLFRRVHDALRAGGVFVNAEHVAGPTPWLESVHRSSWRAACIAAGASADEIAAAEGRMATDRTIDLVSQLDWMSRAGLEDCDCFFRYLHFAVLAGWRPGQAAA